MPEFSTSNGIQYNWTPGFEISASHNGSTICIKANKEGLKSLANHLLNLAQDAVPGGTHMHFDEFNALEEASADILIEKI